MDYEAYRKQAGCRVVRQYSRKAGAQIDLLQKPDGTLLICRIYDHPVPAYEKLVGIRSEYLPRVYGYLTLENGGVLVEEEFVDGLPLSQILVSCRMDTAQVCAVVRSVGRALELLHSKGMIHRDVKPENILVTSAGRVVLLDMDAASRKTDQGDRDTQLLGTVGYAAPEQFGFGRSDARTDVFSLGVLMNVLLTGSHPSKVLADDPLRPIIETCVQMNVDQRYPSMTAVLQRMPKEEAGRVCPECGFVTPGGGCMYCGKPSGLRKRRRWLLPELAAALVLALGLAAVLLWPREEETVRPAGTETPEVRTLLEEPEPEEAEAEEPNPEAPAAEEPSGTFFDPLTEEQIFTGALSEMLAPFTLPEDPATYYMGVQLSGQSNVYCRHSMDPALEVGQVEHHEYQINFWTSPEEGVYDLVKDNKTLERIRKAFGESLTLQFHALSPEEAQLPAAYPGTESYLLDAWRPALMLEMGWEHVGDWILTASGQVEGQALTAQTEYCWEPRSCLSWSPDLTKEEDLVTQLDRYLQAIPAGTSSVLRIQLPAGEFWGQISLPDHLQNARVEITGQMGEDGQTPVTILHGGMDTGLVHCTASSIHFIGAGADRTLWENGSLNYGYYGEQGARLQSCILEGYDHAVHYSDGMKSGENNLFRDNNVAWFINSGGTSGGNTQWRSNRYENNRVAIWIFYLDPTWNLDFWDLEGSLFLNNEVDIRNDLSRAFYAVRCYFGQGEGEGKPRPCAAEGLVNTSPRALDPDFNAWTEE